MARPRPEPPQEPPEEQPSYDEAALLGYLLQSNPHPDAIAKIQPELLFAVRHRLILAGIRECREQGTEPLPIALLALLQRRGDLAAAGGAAYLSSLIEGVPGGPNGWSALAPHLAATRAAAAKRRIESLATDLASAARNGHDPSELVALASRLADQATQTEAAVTLPWVDLTVTPEPGRWLVRSIIPEQGRCLLVAPSGAGKSWVLEDLALAVATGQPWLGIEDFRISGNSGPVLIIDEESSSRRILWRLSRLAAGRSLEMADIAPSVHLSCLAGVNVGDDRTWGTLLSDTRRLRPCLVILDAAIRIIAGNENDAEYVGAFWRSIGRLQEMGAAVAIAHHTGWVEKDRSRGSTDWHGGADVVLTLGKSDGNGRSKLSWAKMKDPPDLDSPEPIWIDRSGRESVRLACGGSALDDKPQGQALEDEILSSLSMIQGISRADLLARMRPDGTGIRAVDASLSKLKAAGKINFNGGKYRLV